VTKENNPPGHRALRLSAAGSLPLDFGRILHGGREIPVVRFTGLDMFLRQFYRGVAIRA
jgi:hypothetical protein